MIVEAIESMESITKEKTDALPKVRLGSFVSYSLGDLTTRKVNIKLINIEKTEDTTAPIPQALNDVPLLMIGTNRAQEDFDLIAGDELLVFFMDNSTDNWRRKGGNIPALEEREDRHSLDYAVAIPVSSHHNLLTQSIIGTHQIKVQAGQKIQIGVMLDKINFQAELIQEFYTLFSAMNALVYTDGDSFATAFTAFKTGALLSLLAKLQLIGKVI